MGTTKLQPMACFSGLLMLWFVLSGAVACRRSTESAPANVTEAGSNPPSELLVNVEPATLGTGSNTPELASTSLTVTTSNPGLIAIQTEDHDLEQISEDEMNSVASSYLEKTDWHDAGRKTITSLIQTYYWSLREGRPDRYSECLSNRERHFAALKQISGLSEQFTRSVTNVLGYNITSLTETNGQIIAIVKHSLTHNRSIYEFLAIVKQQKEFRIEGAKGNLSYGHHGSVPIGLVLGYSHLQDNLKP
jgi:hypothetical protein